MTSRRLASLLIVGAMVLAACSPSKTQISSEESERTDAPEAVADVYDQDIAWEQCGELECAVIQVPLDWSEPDGDTVDLAINRLAAGDQDARIGSLLINPGGPGASGLELTEYFGAIAGEQLLAHYDVIGFDPRGVGASTPVECGPADVIDEAFITDSVLLTQDDVDAGVALTAEFAERCRDDSGPIVEHVDTVSAARDMDIIRAAVGDDQLHYLGYSYGTQLGATYAQLYPEGVGRMVLDGAVDFLLPAAELSRGQATGFEQALTNYLTWCTSTADCALAGDVETARGQLQDLFDTALTDTFPTGTPWDLNGNLMIYGVVVTLYDEASWSFLNMALEEVVSQGTASIMYELANFYLDRDPISGEYLTNSTWVRSAIGCLDDTGETAGWGIDEMLDFRADMEDASPTFGWWFGTGTGCQGWPFVADEQVTSLEATADAAPILVIGTTQDPATPFAWSESLAEQMDSATLIAYDGEGHTAYGRSNQCIIDAVDGYLVEGIMPDSGLTC